MYGPYHKSDDPAELPASHGIIPRKLIVPTVPTRGYTPRSINNSLTPAQALALAELAEGLKRMGKLIRHPADAINHLLDLVGNGEVH